MKTPCCKECKGTGTLHIESEFISIPVDTACWICGGTGLRGMNKEQVKWYLSQYKALDTLRSKILRARTVVEPLMYAHVTGQINRACRRLQISVLPFSSLSAELDEYKRRLHAISAAMVGVSVATE